jgi:hypothetical protein
VQQIQIVSIYQGQCIGIKMSPVSLQLFFYFSSSPIILFMRRIWFSVYNNFILITSILWRNRMNDSQLCLRAMILLSFQLVANPATRRWIDSVLIINVQSSHYTAKIKNAKPSTSILSVWVSTWHLSQIFWSNTSKSTRTLLPRCSRFKKPSFENLLRVEKGWFNRCHSVILKINSKK